MCIYLSMARATLITLLAKIASSTRGHHDGKWWQTCSNLWRFYHPKCSTRHCGDNISVFLKRPLPHAELKFIAPRFIMGKVCFCDTLTETPIVSSKYISCIAQAQEAAWNVDTSAIKTCVPLSFTLVHFQGKNRIKSSLCQESTLIPWSTLLKQKVEGNSATESF